MRHSRLAPRARLCWRWVRLWGDPTTSTAATCTCCTPSPAVAWMWPFLQTSANAVSHLIHINCPHGFIDVSKAEQCISDIGLVKESGQVGHASGPMSPSDLACDCLSSVFALAPRRVGGAAAAPRAGRRCAGHRWAPPHAASLLVLQPPHAFGASLPRAFSSFAHPHPTTGQSTHSIPVELP